MPILIRIFATILLLNTGAVHAQMVVGLNKDSLKRHLVRMPDDTNKVETYILLGQQYEYNVPDSAIYFYKQANTLSTRLNYPTGIIRYVNNITAVYNIQGKFDESLKLHQQSLALCDKYKLDALRIKTLFNIGVVYQLKEDYKAAADHYLAYLPVFERTASPQHLSVMYGNLASLYHTLNQTQKNIDYARKSLRYAEQSNDEWSIGRACNNLANALKTNGELLEREKLLKKALDIGKKIDDMDMIETSLINLGDYYASGNTHDRSIAYFKLSLPLADSLNDAYGKSLALQGIAAGLFMKKQYRQAEQQALEALRYSRENEQHESEAKALAVLADISIGLGDVRASARYREKYDSVYASILSADLLKNVQELEAKYEVEKKQSQILKQNLLLEQKNRETLRQRTLLWISLIGIVVMVFCFFWGYRYYRQRQQLNKKALEALQAEQENIRLKSKLEGQLQERQRISQELHDDVGSGLTSILFLSRAVQGQDNVTGRLRQTSENMVQRMNEIIWVMNHEQDTLDSMVAYTRMHIAEALDNAGIDYKFTVTDPIPDMPLGQEYRRNLYLSAKEAAHNAIKHGGGSPVHISITVDKQLEVIIQDHGTGVDEQKITGFGNGLKNMRRRMEQIGGTFEISSTGGGVKVILTAPLPV